MRLINNPVTRRFVPVIASTILLLWVGSPMAVAQSDRTSQPMPSWTVLVLRLVSSTHVEPTTGVVISDSGLVLVPLQFAKPGDEIVVLDGGKDIIRHGRPAKTVQRLHEVGFAVIQARGLSRSAPTVRLEPLTADSSVRLAAFPPAEMISQGELPLSVPGKIVFSESDGSPGFSGESQMPNVTGALLDDCGYLVGYSIADGVQSLATDQHPVYVWTTDLTQSLKAIDIGLPENDCSGAQSDQASDSEPEAPPQPLPDEQPADSEPDAENTAADETEPEQTPEEESAAENEQIEEEIPTVDQAELNAGQGDENTADETDAISETGEEPESGFPSWNIAIILLIAIAIVTVIVGLGIRHVRARQGSGTETPPGDGEGDEPQTGRIGIDDEPATFEGETTPPVDAMLSITGKLSDGRAFNSSHPVSSRAINLAIGRGDVDIIIDDHTISRTHATLNGTEEYLTVSDLGSTNGTFVNSVPCLKDETFYVQPGDTLTFGQVRLSVTVECSEGHDTVSEPAADPREPEPEKPQHD
jgi:hypothetical protein